MASTTVKKGTMGNGIIFAPMLLLLYPLYSLVTSGYLLATLCLIALAVILIFNINKLIRHLRQLERAAHHLGEGDLSYQLDEKDAGVFNSVVHSINRMGEDVSRTILSLIDTSEWMKKVATDIKTISEQAKQGVLEQERQTELAATAMTQMVDRKSVV